MIYYVLNGENGKPILLLTVLILSYKKCLTCKFTLFHYIYIGWLYGHSDDDCSPFNRYIKLWYASFVISTHTQDWLFTLILVSHGMVCFVGVCNHNHVPWWLWIDAIINNHVQINIVYIVSSLVYLYGAYKLITVSNNRAYFFLHNFWWCENHQELRASSYI